MDTMTPDTGQEEGPVLGPPVEPPADVWANALAGALHDPRSPEELAGLLPTDDASNAGVDPNDLDDAEAFDGADDLDGVGGDDAVEPDAYPADDHLDAPGSQPSPAEPEDGPGWLE